MDHHCKNCRTLGILPSSFLKNNIPAEGKLEMSELWNHGTAQEIPHGLDTDWDEQSAAKYYKCNLNTNFKNEGSNKQKGGNRNK